MLSIIISTYQSKQFASVEENIAKTVGIEYELIKIENPNLLSLTQAYNLGAKKANFDYLLFVHDDVIFKTLNWGEILLSYLSIPSTGIIGIAGSNYVPAAPSGWYITKENNPLEKKDLQKAIALDGVFMAVSKKHFEEILFNEEVKGFHGYDLDFSLRMSRKYQNYILRNIHLEHLSPGKIEKAFIENNIQIRTNLGSHFQSQRNAKLERIAFNNFINYYFKYHPVSYKNLMIVLKFFPLQKLNLTNTFSMLKTITKNIRYRTSIFTK